jgi:acetolactate synthase-1/2/3 large subunit
MEIKYSELLMDWIKEQGYSHCFFVGGGNIMHLLESARTRFECIPVVHEVAAAIAVEYFNEISENKRRAFVLVTAGPGITNAITGIAGAWLESRELLIIGGQAKRENLSKGKGVRQTGHQEVDGVGLTGTITKKSFLIEAPINKKDFLEACILSATPRKGPVFIEICLDASGQNVKKSELENQVEQSNLEYIFPKFNTEIEKKVTSLVCNSTRPTLLIGAGISRKTLSKFISRLEKINIPITLTWNGTDRLEYEHILNMGRPNTYGMRFSNIFLQQSDLIIALGTRLGLQQTGFNWEEFGPLAKIIQVDIDKHELEKGHPEIDLGIQTDADYALEQILEILENNSNLVWKEWLDLGHFIKKSLPIREASNKASPPFVEAFHLVEIVSDLLRGDENIVSCSSGGAYTTMMSGFKNKQQQKVISNYGLASMGYGLSGAIGAAISNRSKNTILVEGDGGFAQNLQELGTVSAQELNLKIIIFSNDGYASIRTMQQSYFNGNFLGCNLETKLKMPKWSKIFEAYDIPSYEINSDFIKETSIFEKLLNSVGPVAFIVSIDPAQTYWPKVTSKITEDGKISSNPIHLMNPELEPNLNAKLLKYLI